MTISRRNFLASSTAGAASGMLPLGARADAAPNWSSIISSYRVPEWFRDVKFGIWAHWSAQCVPEYGDWYARKMYIQGDPFYEHHLRKYGHPSSHGFMEIENDWKAENWDPAYLIERYKKAGARYFMALANHHDNLDAFDSAHHAWNTMRVGPKRDIVGTWEKIARAEGLRFCVSNHSSHAWHWYQAAYGYDAEGPRRGERYDAFRLTKADGAGKWWDGLDPQELYTGPSMAPPDGIDSIAAMGDWHATHDRRWLEIAPPNNMRFVEKWLLRQKDLVEKYRPDMIYMDNYGLPFGMTGVEALAHYYEQAAKWHGSPDVVMTAKKLTPYQRRGLVEDIERGYSDRLRPDPWQTCTCIGDWHYSRWRYEAKAYVPAEQVIQRLCDVVSKNGNLLLSVPMRGDGTIDSEEEKIVDGIGRWMARNGEAAIYGSRPWRAYGEGPTRLAGGMHTEGKASLTAEDVRYTVKDGALYAAFMKWPTAPVDLMWLSGRMLPDAKIERMRLVGGGEVTFDRKPDNCTVTLPPPERDDFVPVVRIDGRGLV